MKKSILAGLLALTLVLSGCAGKGDASVSGSGSGSASGSDGSTSGAEPDSIPTAEEIQTVRETLEGAVETLRGTGTIPGFEEVLNLPLGEASYRYDIADVDGDGYEELYLVQDGGYMAAMVALILDGQGGKLRAELSEFPTLTAYDNGCIRADASHNQGLAGDFWPYALYRYDSESDSYQRIALADAWDGRLHPQDYAGNPFPKDADVSGAGIVYYVAEDGELSGEDGAFAVAPMDQADFEKWEASWQGNASVVQYPLENAIIADDMQAAG